MHDTTTVDLISILATFYSLAIVLNNISKSTAEK